MSRKLKMFGCNIAIPDQFENHRASYRKFARNADRDRLNRSGEDNL